MFRDSEKQYLSALKNNITVDIYLYLSKVYAKLDQPLNSINKLKEGNEKFPFETSLLQGVARIYEVNLKKNKTFK
jgi:tetratricopeptide repeat protein 8